MEMMKDTLKILQENFLKNVSRSYEWRRDSLLQLKSLVTEHKDKMIEAKFVDMNVDKY